MPLNFPVSRVSILNLSLIQSCNFLRRVITALAPTSLLALLDLERFQCYSVCQEDSSDGLITIDYIS